MMEVDVMKKVSESKAMNGRFGKSCDVAGTAHLRRDRDLGRWEIKQTGASSSSRHPSFNWARRLIPR